MKTYKYLGIAPSRNPYDPVYLMFKHQHTKDIIYRKALRWDLKGVTK